MYACHKETAKGLQDAYSCSRENGQMEGTSDWGRRLPLKDTFFMSRRMKDYLVNPFVLRVRMANRDRD